MIFSIIDWNAVTAIATLGMFFMQVLPLFKEI
jgi:hypothetical protein